MSDACPLAPAASGHAGHVVLHSMCSAVCRWRSLPYAAPCPCSPAPPAAPRPAVCVLLPCLMYTKVYRPTGLKLHAIKGVNALMVRRPRAACAVLRLLALSWWSSAPGCRCRTSAPAGCGPLLLHIPPTTPPLPHATLPCWPSPAAGCGGRGRPDRQQPRPCGQLEQRLHPVPVNSQLLATWRRQCHAACAARKTRLPS